MDRHACAHDRADLANAANDVDLAEAVPPLRGSQMSTAVPHASNNAPLEMRAKFTSLFPSKRAGVRESRGETHVSPRDHHRLLDLGRTPAVLAEIV
jgi:hypothetical protein